MKLQAVRRKLRVVRGKEKIKLVLKVLLRPFGYKGPLFLGGYEEEEDRRQEEADEKLLEFFRTGSCDLPIPSKVLQKEETPGVGEMTWKHSYIALAVEYLDKGGLEEVVAHLAELMKAGGIPFQIFCLRESGRIGERLREAGMEVVVFHGERGALADYCKEQPPALVNTHYVTEFLEVFHSLQIPVVEVIHNMYLFQHPGDLDREEQKTRLVDGYIAVSEKAKEVFLHKIPSAASKPITVIGNTWECGKPDKTREEMRKELGMDPDTRIYLTVGSVDARKNQIGLLRAWAVFRKLNPGKAHLLVAGSGTDYEYEHKVKEIFARKGLEESVTFLGQRGDVRNLLEAADVFVLPSYYEGWSVAATEAVSAGVPLIHTDCGSGRELVAGGSNGILVDNPLDHIETYDSFALYDAMHAGINEHLDQLVGALVQMSAGEAFPGEKREAIRQYAGEHFSGEKVLSQYLKVFEEVKQKRTESSV